MPWVPFRQSHCARGARKVHREKVSTVAQHFYAQYYYRGENKGLFVLLSRTQAGPGRTVKQEQEEISRNHVQTFISPSVHVVKFH